MYIHLDALSHLTKLVLEESAQVDCLGPCVFLHALRHLHVHDGNLSYFGGGVGACQNLKHLGCVYGQIAGQAHADRLGTSPDAVHIPSAMTRLTLLESLKLSVGDSPGVDDDRVDLDFVTHLTNLQKLELTTLCSCAVPAGLSALGKLTEVDLHFVQTAQLEVDWQQLISLRTVRIAGSCAFDHRLLQLARAPSLSSAVFQFVPPDWRSAQYFGALAWMFGKYAPEVHIQFGGLEIWDEVQSSCRRDLASK